MYSTEENEILINKIERRGKNEGIEVMEEILDKVIRVEKRKKKGRGILTETIG